MELQHTEQLHSRRKRIIRLLIRLFIGLLIMLTLLSNTLKALTLPKVAVIELSSGQLDHKFQGSGVLKWSSEASLTNSTGWKVKRVAVKEGDIVKKGQALVFYDTKAAKQQLLDEQANMDKLKLTIEELQGNFIEASVSGDQKSINSAKRSIEMSKIDLDVEQRKIQGLKDFLVANSQLVAPFDGLIMKVNATEGLVAASGGSDVQISNSSLGFEFEVLAPADVAAVQKIGDKLDVQLNGDTYEGQIAQIQDSNLIDHSGEGDSVTINTPMKRLLITLQGIGLKGGESAQVELTKPTTDDAILLPNKAIHEDSGGKYIFKIEERNGPLGNDFYIRKTSIAIADSNNNESAVAEGVFEHDQVIIESSQPLQDGDKVRMQ
ncbi:cation efflux system protein [Paenibacillus baekrokdamisoli]|uniref:Cation efflux system protein n=1 Tax=Paenibacillus baekrokdamisoli TaxID=1712516 RepID=A0A3G9J822_9BACL|nr:efflux RND transporter periplasmic adaptor subunit [Paenibacillus baekrokdamisoli]MBB3067644.1 RND family efflux transporter MFP subunit [Paenibacillus baekrokdamisoli]BBH19169.1 cation efflux system protein [Paenibacillus baekrokdamisoli]